MIIASELRKGQVIRHEGTLYKILGADYHVGGGKIGGLVHVKLLNVKTGHQTEHRFTSHDKIEELDVHRETMDFLYVAGDECCFMNPQTFEQVALPKAALGALVPYLTEGMKVQMEFLEGQPLSVDAPPHAEVAVASTGSGIRGEGTDNTYKPAMLTNGLEVLVPQFVKAGDRIRVEIDTGKYLERVQKK
jgi:elongation factor P